jgi:hypothetical protein
MGQMKPIEIRPVAAESALRAIYKVIADWMPPDSELDDRGVIELITQILESHGLPFVADDAFDSQATTAALPRQMPTEDRPPKPS